MKSIKEKYGDLLKEGFTNKTLKNLNEAQISHLHGLIIKPIKEQVKTTTKQVKTTTIPSNIAKTSGANVGAVDIKTDAKGDVIATQMDEEKNSLSKCYKKLGKKFGTTNKKDWTKEQLKEFKKCVSDSKKPIENVDEQIESYIVKLVERHILPKMSKKDLLTMVEQKPVETPTKPDVKPDTAPATRPAHPFRHPRPGTDPAPKAKKSDEKIKKDIMDIISKILKGDEE